MEERVKKSTAALKELSHRLREEGKDVPADLAQLIRISSAVFENVAESIDEVMKYAEFAKDYCDENAMIAYKVSASAVIDKVLESWEETGKEV